MKQEVDAALAELARQGRRARADASWRSRVETRLAGLDDAIADLRTRVNGVLIVVLGAVIGQILLHFVSR